MLFSIVKALNSETVSNCSTEFWNRIFSSTVCSHLLSNQQFSCVRTLINKSLLNMLTIDIKLLPPLLNSLFSLPWFLVFVGFFNAFFLCRNANCELGKEYSLSSGSRLEIIGFIMFTTIQWCFKKPKGCFGMLSSCFALFLSSPTHGISQMCHNTHGSEWCQQCRRYFKIHGSVWFCEHVTYMPPVESENSVMLASH